MPNPRKPSDKRQNRVTKDVGAGNVVAPGSGALSVLVPEPSTPVPKPPVPVSAKARRYWQAFWNSPLAQVIEPNVDAFLLVRWITYVDEWETCSATLRKEGMTVEGSTGQLVLHPLAKHRATVESSLSSIEQRLGLDPKSRALLGLAVNTYKKSAADLMTDIQNIPPIALEY